MKMRIVLQIVEAEKKGKEFLNKLLRVTGLDKIWNAFKKLVQKFKVAAQHLAGTLGGHDPHIDKIAENHNDGHGGNEEDGPRKEGQKEGKGQKEVRKRQKKDDKRETSSFLEQEQSLEERLTELQALEAQLGGGDSNNLFWPQERCDHGDMLLISNLDWKKNFQSFPQTLNSDVCEEGKDEAPRYLTEEAIKKFPGELVKGQAGNVDEDKQILFAKNVGEEDKTQAVIFWLLPIPFRPIMTRLVMGLDLWRKGWAPLDKMLGCEKFLGTKAWVKLGTFIGEIMSFNPFL